MGIPKFYRWLSERYPLLNQPVTATAAPPQIDNLYLDMNGIIHNCTHGNDPNVKLTEEEMILRIFAYLDKLVQIIKPKKMLCMAIDGVAPRAKMNQQRARRFKTGREREEQERAAAAKGEPLSKDRFDSNCITPGTPFMARLGEHLRFFVRLKTSTDQTWKSMKVLFSGHEVPGEGEHKIMEYIRLQKRNPTYKPNQRHCLYGLDADLIMLSLVTHEPHFCLLREVVSYSGNNRGQPAREVLENPCAEHFILFQIGLLREYIGLEFAQVELPFKLDLERIIDDFVLFCMLVGNDFLPALPTLDISEGALNKLLDTYATLLPELGGYLTYGGELDRTRLERFIKCIADLEMETLQERAEDAEYFERKRAKGRGAEPPQAANNGPPVRPIVDIDQVEAELAALINGDDLPAVPLPVATPADLFGPLEDEEEVPVIPTEPTMMAKDARDLFLQGDEQNALRLWKDRYYKQKLECRTPEDERQVLISYIEGLHWVLEYYYRGVASWDWYYPYHFAPMASTFVDLDSITVRFNQGTPFKPFEQLLSVLPASSSKHLPEPYRWLMTDPESPIIDFYPVNFTVDMEGKRADWEGVVKIPFIDQNRLLAAAQLVTEDQLTPEERARNQLGDIMIFSHDPESSHTEWTKSTMPKHYADVVPCMSTVIIKKPPPPLPPKEKGFIPQLLPGTETGIKNPPGFPTLQTMQVTPELRNAVINVFGSPSRKPSLILKLRDLRSLPNAAALTAAEVAKSALGERCYVKWPYLQEAYICGISDQNEHVTKDGSKPRRNNESGSWKSQASAISNTMLSKTGIDIGNCDLLLHVRICTCCVRNIDGTLEKKFSDEEVFYPLQAVLRVHPLEQAQAAAGCKPEDFGMPKLVFKPGMQVLYVGQNYFGCVANLLSATEVKATARKKATQLWSITVQPPPPHLQNAQVQAKRVLRNHVTQYMHSGAVARKLGVSPRILGRITGNLWVVDSKAPSGNRRGDDRMDVGISVKNASKGLCVPGYSQPLQENNGWGYSNALVQVLQQHMQHCAWVWQALEQFPDASPIDLAEVFPDLTVEERKAKAEASRKWINSTALGKRPLVKTSVQMVSDEALLALQVAMPPLMSRPAHFVEIDNVALPLLLPPHDAGELISELAGGDFELGDRVVCLSSRGCPPFGASGTVVGIHDEACEVLFDEEFNGGTTLNGRLRSKSGLAVLKVLLLNIAKPKVIPVAKHLAPKVVRTTPVKAPPAADRNPELSQFKLNLKEGSKSIQAPVGAPPSILQPQPLPPQAQALPRLNSTPNAATPFMLSVADIESRPLRVNEATAAATSAVSRALSGTITTVTSNPAPQSITPAPPSPPTPAVLGLNLLRQLQSSTDKPSGAAMPAVSKHMGLPSPRVGGKSQPPPGLAPPGFGPPQDNGAGHPPGLAGPSKAGGPPVTSLTKPAQEAAAAALQRLPLQNLGTTGSGDLMRGQPLNDRDGNGTASAAVAAATRYMGGDSTTAGPRGGAPGRGAAPPQGVTSTQNLLNRLTAGDRTASAGINGADAGNGVSPRPVRTDISPPPGCFEPPNNGLGRTGSRGLPKGSPGGTNRNAGNYHDGPQGWQHNSPGDDSRRWTSDPSVALGNGGKTGAQSPRGMNNNNLMGDRDRASPTKTEVRVPLGNGLGAGQMGRIASKMDNAVLATPKLPATGEKGFTMGRGKPLLRRGPPIQELVAPGSLPPLSQLNPNAAPQHSIQQEASVHAPRPDSADLGPAGLPSGSLHDSSQPAHAPPTQYTQAGYTQQNLSAFAPSTQSGFAQPNQTSFTNPNQTDFNQSNQFNISQSNQSAFAQSKQAGFTQPSQSALSQPPHAGPLQPSDSINNNSTVPLLQPAPVLQPAPGQTMPGQAPASPSAVAAYSSLLSPASLSSAMAGVRGLNNVDLAQNLLGRLQLSGVDLRGKGPAAAAGTYSSVQVPQQAAQARASQQGYQLLQQLQNVGLEPSAAPTSGDILRQDISASVAQFSQTIGTASNLHTLSSQSVTDSPQVRQMLEQLGTAGRLFPPTSAANQSQSQGHFLLQRMQAAALAARSQNPSNLTSPTAPQSQLLSPRSDAPLLQPANRSNLLQPAPQHLQASMQPSIQSQLSANTRAPIQTQAPGSQAAALQALQAALLASTAALTSNRTTARDSLPPTEHRPLPSCFLQPSQQTQQAQHPNVSLGALAPLLASSGMQLSHTPLHLGGNNSTSPSTMSLQHLLASSLATPVQPLHLTGGAVNHSNNPMLSMNPTMQSTQQHLAQQLNLNSQQVNMNPSSQSSTLLNILHRAASGANPSPVGGLLYSNSGPGAVNHHHPTSAVPSMGQQLLQSLQRGGVKPEQLLNANAGMGGMNAAMSGISPNMVAISAAMSGISPSMGMQHLAQALMQQQQQQQVMPPQPTLQSLLSMQAPGVLGGGGMQPAQHHHSLMGGAHTPSQGLSKELLALLQGRQAGSAAGGMMGGYAGSNQAGNIPAVHGYDLASLQGMHPPGYSSQGGM